MAKHHFSLICLTEVIPLVLHLVTCEEPTLWQTLKHFKQYVSIFLILCSGLNNEDGI